MADYTALAKKIFVELCERIPISKVEEPSKDEGIITSVTEFISLINEAATQYYKTFAINDRDTLKIIEEFPKDLFQRINNESGSTDIDNETLRDIRIVTYAADELPAVLSAHTPGGNGIRNIKPRLVGIYDDPEFTGYSTLRYAKDIEATVHFKVWGVNATDIRARASMLRKIVETNVWYFKHKGLREIVWTGAKESDMWDKQNLVKMKEEKYLIRFSEIQETREKNIEQVVIQLGLD